MSRPVSHSPDQAKNTCPVYPCAECIRERDSHDAKVSNARSRLHNGIGMLSRSETIAEWLADNAMIERALADLVALGGDATEERQRAERVVL